MSVRNIIWDLGNVIIHYDQDKIIGHFTQKEDEIAYLKDQIFHGPEWALMDLGEITNEIAAERINQRNHSAYEALTKQFLQEWYKTQPINTEIVDIAKKLKEKGYRQYVISNIAIQNYEYFKKEVFFGLCDGIAISAYEHSKKPDVKIFTTLLERYGLQPEECLFIDDDDTGKSYETANGLGIQGRRITPNSAEDVLRLLGEFGINP